ncbi:MAG: phytanoyl-CoA dioxygenase, partial [Candidatus Poribacteria bacterium]|nr:phytanoyl-CoA dioxygenase [Candidatus Poribacteria bacterium]
MSITDQENDAIAEYIREGEKKARELGNRGPIKFNSDGSLDNQILGAYSRYGFYVFEDVVTGEELSDLQTELEDLLERAPYTKDALVDAKGRPAFGSEFSHPVFNFAKPLSDPVGGTSKNKGRHHVKMSEPEIPPDAPEYVLYTISGPLQLMDSCLRLYGHP